MAIKDTLYSVGRYEADHPKLAASLKASLERRVGEYFGHILSMRNWDEVCRLQGKIVGLQEAIEMAERAEKILNER